MATRGTTLNPGYRSGSHWATCDSCGFQFRSEDLRETWDNRWVCNDDYEVRHSQDFLRVKKEKISVEQPIRLENTDISVAITCSVVTSSGVAGQAVAGCMIAGALNPISQTLIPSGTFNNEM